jgi:methionine-rich copper-binding protein CopC
MNRIILPALVIALLASTASTAIAHAFLDNAIPKVGSVVTSPPKDIRIQFTQEVEAAFSHIQLFTADGQMVAVGQASVDPNDSAELTALIKGALVPGKYEVRWDVVSVDTHRTNGHFPFTYQP